MTGVDAGIIVLNQLVDQEKWIKVLHKIGEHCSDVPQFPVNCNDYRSFTLQDLAVLKITEKFNFRGEHMFSGWRCDPFTDHYQSSSHKKQISRRTYFEKLMSTCSYPPVAYFFDIGGFLCFPVFCKHFKFALLLSLILQLRGIFITYRVLEMKRNMILSAHLSSQVVRVTGHRASHLEVLAKCFNILLEYFPNNVTFFQEATSKDYNHCHVKCHQPKN